MTAITAAVGRCGSFVPVAFTASAAATAASSASRDSQA